MADPKTGFKGDIVLDMFNGTGATCTTAKALKRHYIGIDLNSEYCRIARERIASGNFGEGIDPYSILLEFPKVRNPQNSRQIELFPEKD
jgi:tRNA G10  N-methylase Trm11